MLCTGNDCATIFNFTHDFVTVSINSLHGLFPLSSSSGAAHFWLCCITLLLKSVFGATYSWLFFFQIVTLPCNLDALGTVSMPKMMSVNFSYSCFGIALVNISASRSCDLTGWMLTLLVKHAPHTANLLFICFVLGWIGHWCNDPGPSLVFKTFTSHLSGCPKLQTQTALNTTGAEFNALSEGLCTAIPTMNLIDGLRENRISIARVAKLRFKVFECNTEARVIASVPSWWHWFS